jgi:hypothetical protein
MASSMRRLWPSLDLTALTRPGSLQVVLFVLLSAIWVATLVTNLPSAPHIETDSESYLTFADYRPHGYPILLAVLSALLGGLHYLPAIQCCAFFCSVIFLGVAVSLRVNCIVAAPVVLTISAMAPGIYFTSIMSDAMFSSFITAGAAFLVLFAHRGAIALILLASFFFGAAAATRTIGYVPLFIFFVVAGIASLRNNHSLLRFAALPIPALIVLSFAATSNFVNNGRLSIGSFGGASLLGKGLVLARPLPNGQIFSPLNWTAEDGQQARDAIAKAPSFTLKMLMTRQYYEYLRWFDFWDKAKERWPQWRLATTRERGILAGDLAKAYIAKDITGYTKLALLDYASLWLVPRVLTRQEVGQLTQEYDGMPEEPLLRAFSRTPAGSIEYYRVIPAPMGRLYVYSLRAVSIGFVIASLFSFGWFFLAVRESLAKNVDILFLMTAVHATIFSISLAEAGLERYAGAMWPLLAAGLSLVVFRFGTLSFAKNAGC